jgi:hypothetical protein
MFMKQVILITVLLCSFAILSIAQITPPELQSKIAGKKNLAVIMKEVEKFYKEEEQEKKKEKILNANINVKKNLKMDYCFGKDGNILIKQG